MNQLNFSALAAVDIAAENVKAVLEEAGIKDPVPVKSEAEIRQYVHTMRVRNVILVQHN